MEWSDRRLYLKMFEEFPLSVKQIAKSQDIECCIRSIKRIMRFINRTCYDTNLRSVACGFCVTNVCLLVNRPLLERLLKIERYVIDASLKSLCYVQAEDSLKMSTINTLMPEVNTTPSDITRWTVYKPTHKSPWCFLPFAYVQRESKRENEDLTLDIQPLEMIEDIPIDLGSDFQFEDSDDQFGIDMNDGFDAMFQL